IRFSCASALKSCALPESRRSWPGSLFSLRISSIRFPLMSFEPAHSTLSTVDETTYLGMVFIFSPNSPVPGMVGHAAAKPAYVLRPNSSASLACSSFHLNCPASSLKKGNDHLPGSSKTPSSETYSVATSLMSASSEKVGDGGSGSRRHQLYELARPESTSRRKVRRGRLSPPPRNANRPLADHGYDCAGAGVARVRRIAGVGLDDDDAPPLTRNLRPALAHGARDDHGHVGRKGTVRRRRAGAGSGRP